MEHLSNSCPAGHSRSFVERFRLAEFEEMGVLLDVQTGAFHHLNHSATRICAGLQQGQSPREVAELLGKHWRKKPEQLKEVIDGLLADLDVSPPGQLTNPVIFQEDATGLRMCIRGQDVLHFDRAGRTITAPGWPAGSSEERGAALLLAAPHLLVLRHRVVLHASAVRFSRGALAFCGQSGQGKTTTARYFATCGADLLAEDLLVVSLEDGVPRVILGAEAEIRRWAAEQAGVLTRQERIDATDIDRVSAGSTVPLDEIVFLRRVRQPTGCLVRSTLPRAEGMIHLLENSFAELGRRDVWLDIFQQSERLTRSLPFALLTVPEGLDLLAAGVADYSRTLT